MLCIYIFLNMCQPKEVSLIPPKITLFIYLNVFSVAFDCLLGGFVRLRWNNREKHYTDRLKIIEVNIFDGCDSVVFFMRN